MNKDNEIYFDGDRGGVLLIHGLTGTPNELRSVAHGLRKAGHAVLCVQLAGHCGSVDDLVATRAEDWVASVTDAAGRLLQRFPRIFVGGLSMGAVLALRFAAEQPEHTQGLALYGTTFFYDGWAIPPISRLAFLLPLVTALGIGRRRMFMETFPYGLKSDLLRRLIFEKMQSGNSSLAGLPGNPWPALAQFQRLSRAMRRDLHRVHAPVLAVHARHDDVASIHNVEVLQRRVSAPVEAVLLDDSYHMITLDQQRREVIEHTLAFIERQLGRDKSSEAAPRGHAALARAVPVSR